MAYCSMVQDSEAQVQYGTVSYGLLSQFLDSQTDVYQDLRIRLWLTCEILKIMVLFEGSLH